MTSRCGFIALIGRPNVGKSTLLNQIIGQKISITSKKPQTTRHRITGVSTQDKTQLVFVDTPGIHQKTPKAMNRVMNREAFKAIGDVDVVVFMVDSVRWTAEDEAVFSKVKALSCPVVLVINKVDTVKEKEKLLPHMARLSEEFQFTEVLPISAKKGTHVDKLKNILSQLVPESPHFYPEEQVTDRSDRFRAAELIREKLTRFLGEELPYALTVEIEQMQKKGEQLEVHGTIWVERDSQKKIVIGAKGLRLKEMGTEARKDMIELFGCRVHLQLWVKVREGWSDDERALKSLGYFDMDEE